MNGLFLLCAWLHPWRCSSGFEDGPPWRWITGRLGLEESFKGADGSGAGSSNVVEGTGRGRVPNLVDEILDEQ